jgi:hypothetical protein
MNVRATWIVAIGAASLPALASADDALTAACRAKVAEMYSARADAVLIGAPATADDGSKTLEGSVDQGAEGVKEFLCEFDASGKLLQVRAMTSDGE